MITSLVISTKDRQKQACESLASFREGVRRPLDFIVYDQTEQDFEYECTRFCGPAEVERYINQLASYGLPRDVLTYGLVGGHGGYRNVILLDTIGQQVLSTDDDTRCRFYTPPNQQTALSLNLDPYYEWYRDRDHWQQSLTPVPVDILAEHEKLLGRTTQQQDKVRVVACGFVGDSAADYNFFQLASFGSSHERLVSDYAAYRETREVMQVCQAPVIAKASWLRTISYSFDNTSPLPPFLANGRGECGVFAAMLGYMRTEVIGHTPWAIEHVPPLRTGYKKLTFGADSLVYAIANVAKQKNWTQLAQALIAFDKLPVVAVRNFIETAHAESTKPVIANCWTALKVYKGQPELWAKDVASFIQTASEPLDLTDDQALALQHEVVMYGRLLLHWLEIWETSRRLHFKGIRPSYKGD